MISAPGSTESLSLQWQRREERGGKKEKSTDKGELKAEWRAEKIDKESVGEWKI